MKYVSLTIACAFLALGAMAQKPNRIEKKFVRNIKSHIIYLASDELEGRGTGSAGEQLSAKYVEEQFALIGLQPKGDNNTYKQSMDIPTLRMAQANTSLKINKDAYTLFTDFYPLSPSANEGGYEGLAINVSHGVEDQGLNWNDYENVDVNDKAVLIKVELPDNENPHSKFSGWSGIEYRAKFARDKGAMAVVYYSSNKDNAPNGKLSKTLRNIGIPVFFTNKDLSKLVTPTISLETEIMVLSNEASNVIGFIDNGADKTVVIGAHHDHLGYGQLGGSLAEKSGQIHNGADDNASGVASLIELARYINKKSKHFSNNNYMFIAFTAEELGLVGSKYFVSNPTIPLKEINYMINMDMVGHLDSTQKTIIINGVGTSPSWNSVLAEMDYSTKKIAKTKTTESGIGASDHTSFYLNGIPSVHFFTGQHKYYHKPTDDVQIVNMNGTAFVTNYICQYLYRMDALNTKVEYTKTKDETQGRMRFKVTLGVMPDYVYDGEGMRIDGVREGKAADKAGIVKGDVVIIMNGKPIANMQDYMKMLSSLKKGDKIPVVIKRDDKTLELDVQF